MYILINQPFPYSHWISLKLSTENLQVYNLKLEVIGFPFHMLKLWYISILYLQQNDWLWFLLLLFNKSYSLYYKTSYSSIFCILFKMPTSCLTIKGWTGYGILASFLAILHYYQILLKKGERGASWTVLFSG